MSEGNYKDPEDDGMESLQKTANWLSAQAFTLAFKPGSSPFQRAELILQKSSKKRTERLLD